MLAFPKSPHPSYLILLTVLNNSPTDISTLWENKQHSNQHLSTLNNCHWGISTYKYWKIYCDADKWVSIVLNHCDYYRGHLSYWQTLMICRWGRNSPWEDAIDIAILPDMRRCPMTQTILLGQLLISVACGLCETKLGKLSHLADMPLLAS